MSAERILQEKLAASQAAARRQRPSAPDGSVAILAETTVVSVYPTTAGVFYACTPLLVDGPEIEGASASFTSSGDRTFYALNLGTGIPPVGTRIIAHACAGRWTFRFDG
ncbi:MAG: hypothetical protein ACP5XB_02445 [Isosphaeraceae bacterium]